jgi:hypothetical protein
VTEIRESLKEIGWSEALIDAYIKQSGNIPHYGLDNKSVFNLDHYQVQDTKGLRVEDIAPAGSNSFVIR